MVNKRVDNMKSWRTSAKALVSSLFTISLLTLSLSHAAFKNSDWGTRPAGMGNAYIAVADDSNASLHNAAGLGRLNAVEGSVMYAKPFTGLDLHAGADGKTSLGMNHIALAAPLNKWGTFGVTWANFNVQNMYREDVWALSYGRSLHNVLWPSKNVPLYAGVTAKRLSTKFELDDLTRQTEATSALSPFRHGTSKSAFSVDVGLQANLFRHLWIGASGRNLNSPDLGLQQADRVPREIRTGVAWSFGRSFFADEFVQTLEYAQRTGGRAGIDSSRLLGGMESWFGGRRFALRLGGSDRDFTMGGSVAHQFSSYSLRLDYAFAVATQLEEAGGTHRLSLTLRHGPRSSR
jgi:hypothetical protein